MKLLWFNCDTYHTHRNASPVHGRSKGTQSIIMHQKTVNLSLNQKEGGWFQIKMNTIIHQKQSICPGVNRKVVGFSTEGKSSMHKILFHPNQTRNGITFLCIYTEKTIFPFTFSLNGI